MACCDDLRYRDNRYLHGAASVTRYRRPWDRRGRLLNAVQWLLAGVIVASDESVAASGRPRNEHAERLYARSKRMVARIKRELENG